MNKLCNLINIETNLEIRVKSMNISLMKNKKLSLQQKLKFNYMGWVVLLQYVNMPDLGWNFYLVLIQSIIYIHNLQNRVVGGCIPYNDDVIMDTTASQTTSLTIVYSTVYSRHRSKKTSKLRVTGLCEGNSPVTDEFPAQRASNAENVSFDDVFMTSWTHFL